MKALFWITFCAIMTSMVISSVKSPFLATIGIILTYFWFSVLLEVREESKRIVSKSLKSMSVEEYMDWEDKRAEEKLRKRYHTFKDI